VRSNGGALDKITNIAETGPQLRSFAQWLREIPASKTTGWRWRRKNWIRTVNLSGKIYVSADAITEFIRRAEAGEFSAEAKTPSSKSKTL